MKKILLSATAVAISLASYAQSECVSGRGISSTGFTDDFQTTAEIGDEELGVYYWGDDTPDVDNNFFGVTYDRDSANAKLSLSITQAFNEYTPTGLGFGDSNGDGTGTLKTIDLSSNATFSFDVTNEGDSTVIFRIGLKDNAGKTVDSYKIPDGEAWGTAYLHSIELTVNSGETQTFSGDFAGGVYADYTNGEYVDGFDFTNVEAVIFTVVNGNNTGDPDYQPYELKDYPVSFANLSVGDCPTGLSNGLSQAGVSIYPNPAVSTLNISEELENVSVFNAQGIEVLTATKATQLNVETLESGVYVLKSDKGTSTFVVK